MISAISGGMPLTSQPVRKIPLLGVVLLAGLLLAAGKMAQHAERAIWRLAQEPHP
jgi:hypothetical protein